MGKTVGKSIFILFCVAVIMGILAGCSIEENEGVSFTATVLENEDTSLLVEPVEGSRELSSADKIIVYVRDADLLDAENTELTITDIRPGEQVEIFYDGAIAESYPAQIHGCYRVILLD